MRTNVNHKYPLGSPSFIILSKFSCIDVFFQIFLYVLKKSFKVPNGQSEAVNGRRTDNTMAKIKGRISIHKTLQRKLKIEQHKPH